MATGVLDNWSHCVPFQEAESDGAGVSFIVLPFSPKRLLFY